MTDHDKAMQRGEHLALLWRNNEPARADIVAQLKTGSAIELAAMLQFIAYDMSEAKALAFMLETVHTICENKFCVDEFDNVTLCPNGKRPNEACDCIMHQLFNA
jgi:hypothetical protein